MAAVCTTDEGKENNDGYFVGRWKQLVFMNGTEFWGSHDVNITKHTSQGVIEGELIGTQNPGKQYITYATKSGYIGVLKNNQMTLTYQGSDPKYHYTASIILTVNEYTMDGIWTDSTGKRGTCQWIKAYKLT